MVSAPAPISNQPDVICQMLGGLVSEPEWSFAHCGPAQTSALSHGYHRYPAKFIPQLVDRLFDEYLGPADSQPRLIDDPFLGSGTTAVCAITRGYRAAGTDISEVAWLIARAKATPLDPTRVEPLAERLLEALRRSNHFEPYIPDCERLDYWYPAHQKGELGRILRAIREVEEEDIRTFLLCGFSHVLKNCSRWSMKSSKPTIAKLKSIPEPVPVYARQVNKMLARNRQFWHLVPPAVRAHVREFQELRCGDARQQPCADNSVDLIVTSSPYVTSYEYADLHQLTALWLEFARDLRSWRRKFIGTAFSPLGGESRSIIAGEIVDRILARNPSLAAEVATYFYDMEQCFAESHRVLKPGARACYVIGNTSLAGVEIKNAEFFVESMQIVGLEVERVIKRDIPSKILPQTRDATTGRFVGRDGTEVHAYPSEYIVIARKPQ